MATRMILLPALAGLLLLPACEDQQTGPIVVSAIGAAPTLANPNLQPLNPPSAFLIGAAAEGLVRFDAAGQIEPALAQSWIVSDDGIRYTFRLAPRTWQNGSRITAEQVVARLRAAVSGSSRNPLKPNLGAVREIARMTDDVLEITLRGPRSNFLQLLAQPEMAVIRNGEGSGPYRATPQGPNAVLLSPIPDEDEEAAAAEAAANDILLRGERAALAVARFDEGLADLVVGGTAADLPLARAADPPADSLVFDPVAGLFGLTFARAEGALRDRAVRRALSMAIDRASLVAALGVPGLQPRESLVPAGVEELPQPVAPDWVANPLPMRRELASRAIAAVAEGEPLELSVALPDGPGYRIVFAHLQRDWRAIGVSARRVKMDEEADLRLIDAVAPANLASWYLRRFSCESNRVCDAAADEMMAGARIAPNGQNRRALLANADRMLAEAAPFIPIAAPIRWSLVSPRLTGFRANPFGRHPAGALVAPAP